MHIDQWLNSCYIIYSSQDPIIFYVQELFWWLQMYNPTKIWHWGNWKKMDSCEFCWNNIPTDLLLISSSIFIVRIQEYRPIGELQVILNSTRLWGEFSAVSGHITVGIATSSSIFYICSNWKRCSCNKVNTFFFWVLTFKGLNRAPFWT